MQNSNLYKCKLCKTDFIPRKTGGSEKIYCSKNVKISFTVSANNTQKTS